MIVATIPIIDITLDNIQFLSLPIKSIFFINSICSMKSIINIIAPIKYKTNGIIAQK
ncbi:hypothetical protein FACS189459_5470 [Bacilli bacterium]|nr:hypothetical protein FACS189459_5470 [Bacilli bacterium]